MPVLRSIAERFESERPLDGVCVAACLHVTAETGVLARTLTRGGADVRLAAANPLSTQDDVVEALAADGCFTPTSLDTPFDDVATTLGDMIGEDDTTVEAVEAKVVLEPLLAELPLRERRILYMRFHEERSQQDIADAVGLTQAQVSRILARLLTQLRAGLGGSRPAA
jgi:RNA polymerase sigma-B factor